MCDQKYVYRVEIHSLPPPKKKDIQYIFVLLNFSFKIHIGANNVQKQQNICSQRDLSLKGKIVIPNILALFQPMYVYSAVYVF